MQIKFIVGTFFRNKYSVIEVLILEIVYLGGIFMAVYSEPIKWAIIIFPFLAFFISGALLIYEYRKYGSFVWTRAMILYSFVFYLLCAYFLVILPLPSRAEVAQYTGPTMNCGPFFIFISGILNETAFSLKDPSTYLPALKQHAVLEPLFTVFY